MKPGDRQPPTPSLPTPAPEPQLVAAPGPLVIKQRLAAPTNYSHVHRIPTLIVLHCTDGCEGPTQDDNTAAEFAHADLVKKKSAHYVVDSDSVTCCVPDELTAWHGGHHANALGIGIELCGRAAQTRSEWLDTLSLPTLQLGARLVAELCRKHAIPAAVVNERGLLTGQRGITTHAFCAEAWRESDHWDPGPGFPLGAFVLAVERALAVPPP